MSTPPDTGFATSLLDWHRDSGRHDLPWQHPRTPYRVWLAEVMLQQTQVRTVIPYFLRFVDALPTLEALARAPSDTVLALWSGLGYYARARNLHAAAKTCVERHAGTLPADFESLLALPGIGRSTAGAILAQAHGQRWPILDGNVRRVLCRYHGIDGWPGQSDIQARLWDIAQSNLPHSRLADYTQAQMDLGATVCTRGKPDCARCPLQVGCVARREDRTAALPASRPGKALPRRQTVMLVIDNGVGDVLLQRRPPTGVWSGLWSLPEASDPAAAALWLERRLPQTGPGQTLPPIDHVFSHFRLRIQPLLVRGAQTDSAIGDDDLRWLPTDELAAIGLPAPVRRLLEAVYPLGAMARHGSG